MPAKTLIHRHAILAYFTLTFAISWGSVLLIIGGTAGIPGTTPEISALFPLVYLATVAGPSLASILMIGLVSGRTGYRDLFSRLIGRPVGALWYAIALLIGPISVLATLFALSLVSSTFLPGFLQARDAVSAPGALAMPVGVVVIVAVVTGILEELGWTGFAIPRLWPRHGILTTGLSVGVLWGAWHFLSNIWASSSPSDGVPLALLLPVLLFSFLPPYRILMVWVYSRTESLLVAILMHGSLVTFWLISTPPGITGLPLIAWYLSWAALLWAMVAVSAVIDRAPGTGYKPTARVEAHRSSALVPIQDG